MRQGALAPHGRRARGSERGLGAPRFNTAGATASVGQRTGLDGSDGGPSARVTVIEPYPPGGGLSAAHTGGSAQESAGGLFPALRGEGCM